MSFHRCFFFAAAVPVLLACPSAYAGDPAAAQGLFNDAKKLIAEEKWAEACPKLEESQRLDPGIGTLFNLANCHEHIGRNATAWAEFLEVAFTAKSKEQPAREKAARDRASALEPSLTRLTITVAAADTPDLAVTRDGESVGRAQWGMSVPVDPGAHKLVATAPGKHRWETSVQVAPQAKSTQVTVPALTDEAPAAAPVAVVPAAPIAPPPPTDAAHEKGRTQRLAAIGVAGAGVVMVVVGAGFGLSSKGKHDDAEAHCDGTNHCDATGVSLRDDALHAGTASTVFFGLGAAAIATGAVLFFIAPRESTRWGRIQASPLIGQNTSGLSIRGAW